MNCLEKIRNLIVSSEISLITALKIMDEIRKKMLFIYNGDKFDSILTIGDIQRAIIKNVPMNSPVSSIIDRKNKIYASVTQSKEFIKTLMMNERIDCMPVLNKDGDIVDVYFWNDFFSQTKEEIREQINLPVVIMAGGKGTRLKPITNIIPKPLVPIGDKTILEEIMDQFERIGCKEFYMSVNYKSDILRFYLGQLDHKYQIELFEESTPLGTIGSVSLLKGKITSPFFVSNCDIVIDQDYRDVYEYHKNNKNDITIVTAVKSISIPYGVIETGDNGLMTGLKEKPEQTYMINTGVYILNPNLIEEIPEGVFFHITHLIEKVQARSGRVGCFPVSEHAWRDMGEWPEYLKLIKVL